MAALALLVLLSSSTLAAAQLASAPAGAALGAGYLAGGAMAPAAAKVVAKKKVVPAVKKGPQPVTVKCVHGDQNPPYRYVTCKVKSTLKVPVCPKFTCSPPPPGNCQTGPGAGGISNQACSWSITPNCSLPSPMYPTRGNEWGFGWIFTEPGPVSVQLQSFQRVGFQTNECP